MRFEKLEAREADATACSGVHTRVYGSELEALAVVVAVLGPGVLGYSGVQSAHVFFLFFLTAISTAGLKACVAIATNPPSSLWKWAGSQIDKGAVSAHFHCSQAVLNLLTKYSGKTLHTVTALVQCSTLFHSASVRIKK